MPAALVIAAAVFAAAFPLQLLAADAVIDRMSGEVLVRAAGEKAFTPAHAKAPLLFGDEVKTSASAVAHVVTNGGAAILLRPNTTMKLGGTADQTSLEIRLGEFLIGLKKKLAPKQSFQVRTPAAVAAVRGTLFWGLTDAKKDSTYASFGDTLVISAQGRTVRLTPGNKVKIPFGKKPGTPGPSGIPLSYVDNFAVEGSIQDLGALVDLPKEP